MGTVPGRLPYPSLWVLHPRLRVLQAPGFCFHHSTCHVVLSVHQHVLLEGQAPSDVRGTGERQAGDTRYHGKEQESLELFPAWLMNPYHAWHLPCALVSVADSKQLVSPSQPRHLPVKQSAAWRAELALTCLAGPPRAYCVVTDVPFPSGYR